jgi:hypothetical protein
MLKRDDKGYGGSGYCNSGGLEALPVASLGKYYSLTLNAPLLGAVFLTRQLVR